MAKRVTGYDGKSIPRVYAEDDYVQTANAFCREEAAKYVKRRPDTGPLSAWTFFDDEGDRCL